MSDIFRGARRVIIWLVSPSEAMRAIKASTLRRQCRPGCAERGHTKDWGLDRSPKESVEYDTHWEPVPVICGWLQALLRNPYWLRLWILQEVLLARDIVVWYGNDIVSWARLEEHCEENIGQPQLHFLIDHNRVSGRAKHRLPIFASLSTTVSASAAMTPLDIIEYSCESQCQDARDKIYGVQNLFLEKDRLAVDYSKDLREVWGDVTLLLLKLATGHSPGHRHGLLLKLAESMGITEAGTSFSTRLEAVSVIWDFSHLEEAQKTIETRKALKYVLQASTDQIHQWFQAHWYESKGRNDSRMSRIRSELSGMLLSETNKRLQREPRGSMLQSAESDHGDGQRPSIRLFEQSFPAPQLRSLGFF